MTVLYLVASSMSETPNSHYVAVRAVMTGCESYVSPTHVAQDGAHTYILYRLLIQRLLTYYYVNNCTPHAAV